MDNDYRILILGAGGFVGQHLQAELERSFGSVAEIVATSLHADPVRKLLSLDVLNLDDFRYALQALQPSHVINLAGVSSPVQASKHPELSWRLHATVPEAIGRLILQNTPDCCFLHVSSGLIYGRTALSGAAMTEDCAIEPMDTYSLTKATGDLALGVLAGEGLKCLRVRPFNHTGPGQSADFVVPAFAAQLAGISARASPHVMHVGNLEAERDFLDVRDVVSAYAALIQNSKKLLPGSVYNIAAGRTVSIEKILNILIRISGQKVKIKENTDRQRKSDLPILLGSAKKLIQDTGWAQKFELDQTLRDTYEDIKRF